MEMKKYVALVLCALLVILTGMVLFSKCKNAPGGYMAMKPRNAIYYWKTQFKLSSYEKDFIKEHDIKKMYVRFFDVDYGQDKDGLFKAIPIATTLFVDTVPTRMEVVPTVYITTKAIKADSAFAQLMYKRIMAMAKRNRINNVHEIQVDCDWTNSTKDSFFKLCADLRDILHKDSISLSVTIRLHQLKKECPPADYGVLMLYNTGSLYNPNANSILSYNDVKPYLSSDQEYALPLDVALPIYSWGIWMRKNEFMSILHKTDFTDTLSYKQIDKRKYIVLKDHYLEGHNLRKGDIIRMETSPLEDIIKVKQLAFSRIRRHPRNIILYHLDSSNIAQYSKENIRLIYKK